MYCQQKRIASPFFAFSAITASLAIAMGLAGCSASKALRQPEKKNVSVLEHGTPRGSVILELGKPYLTENHGGRKVDYFTFTQGYGKGTKVARATLHGAASVVTLGLWELIGNPVESVFDGTEVQLRVAYDDEDRLEAFEAMKGEEVIQSVSREGSTTDPFAGTTAREHKESPATTAPVATAPPVSRPAVTPPPQPRPLATPAPSAEPVEPPQPVAGLDFGNYYALVIGNDNYRSMPKLQTARSDARAVAALLEQGYGFRVRLLEDATRVEILGAMAWLRRDLGPRDNLLIYYGGHGVLDKEADEGFWLPVDAERQNEANWVANADISRTLKAMSAKHVMVVADSCFSGKLLRGVQVTVPSYGYLSRIAEKRARVALASGGLEPVEDSSSRSRHSPFASAFLAALEENQSVMDGTRLFERIRQPVMLNTDQTPEYANIRKAGHDGGDFLFVRPSWLASAKVPATAR